VLQRFGPLYYKYNTLVSTDMPGVSSEAAGSKNTCFPRIGIRFRGFSLFFALQREFRALSAF
jgi:hypothetical protein